MVDVTVTLVIIAAVLGFIQIQQSTEQKRQERERVAQQQEREKQQLERKAAEAARKQAMEQPVEVVFDADIQPFDDFDTVTSIEKASFPITNHDGIRFGITASRESYFYLFWLGADGRAQTVWPWVEYESKHPPKHTQTKGFQHPPTTGECEEISGSNGIHAVILITSSEPLLEVMRIVSELNNLGFKQDGLFAVNEELLIRIDNGNIKHSSERGLSGKTRKSNNPVLLLKSYVQKTLTNNNNVDDIKVICFAFGDRTK